MSCRRCHQGAFACNLCNTRFCDAACWDVSQHVCPIGTKAELDEEVVHRMQVMGGRPFRRIFGPMRVLRYTYNGQDIVLFGEVHEPLLRRNQLDVEIEEDRLQFTGSGVGGGISVTRMLYAIAASSQRQKRQTDIFYEHPYDAVKKKVDYVVDDDLALNKIHELATHMKCTTLVRDRQPECDVYPTCRFHVADYRDMSLTRTFTAIFFRLIVYVMKRESPATKLRFATAVRTFIDAIGLDWERHYFTIATDSDDFVHDLAEWVGPHVELLRIEQDDDDAMIDRYVNNLVYLTTATAENANVTLKIRKQLEQVNPHVARMIRWYYASHTKYVFTSLDWLSDANQIMLATDEDFIHSQMPYMDVPLLCRLFRFESKLSVVYAGDLHIEVYEQFFRWWRESKPGAVAPVLTMYNGRNYNPSLPIAQFIELDSDGVDYLNNLVQ